MQQQEDEERGSFWYRLAYDWSPPRHPVAWQILNFICLIWSTLLVIEIAWVTEGTNTFMDQLERTHFYIIWGIGTCLIWSVEVGLTLFYNYHHDTLIRTTTDENGDVVSHPVPSRASLIWKNGETWFELILAVVFLFQTIDMLRTWRKAHGDVAEEYLDALISAIAYAYQVWKLRRDSQIINNADSNIDLENVSEPLAAATTAEQAVGAPQSNGNDDVKAANDEAHRYGTLV